MLLHQTALHKTTCYSELEGIVNDCHGVTGREGLLVTQFSLKKGLIKILGLASMYK